MTDLSPAAQAILAACGCPDTDSPFRLVARGFAGAAIRAAVANTQQRQYNECWICDANELLAIAAELETV